MNQYEPITIPGGKKTGCLPRVTKVGECFDKLEDRMEIIPESEWVDWINHDDLDMGDHVTEILDQNGVGSCATESATQGMMICRSLQGLPHVLLNPWSMYCFTSGGRDGGSNIDTNLKWLQDTGVLPMELWPRSKGWRTRPSDELLEKHACKYRIDEAFDCSTRAEVGTALIRKMPVVFGWSGHSCVFTHLRKKGRYANSWGDWGDNGFGDLSLGAINFGYGAFAIRTVIDA